MDILWGNVNGHFVGKCQCTFCGGMPVPIFGNGTFHGEIAMDIFMLKNQWTFYFEMILHIL